MMHSRRLAVNFVQRSVERKGGEEEEEDRMLGGKVLALQRMYVMNVCELETEEA